MGVGLFEFFSPTFSFHCMQNVIYQAYTSNCFSNNVLASQDLLIVLNYIRPVFFFSPLRSTEQFLPNFLVRCLLKLSEN